MPQIVTAQQEAVALYQFLEKRGHRPSVRSIGRILRDELGLRCTESHLRAWLKNFVASPTQLTLTNVASPTRLRAHNMVPLVSKKSATQTSSPSAPIASRVLERRTPAEIVADTALSLIRPRVEPALNGMTWTTWRQRNRRVAVDMARAGLDAAAIDAAHQEFSDHLGTVAMSMTHAQLHLGRRIEPEEVQLGIEDVMPPDELKALRERQFAKHPEWRRAEAQ